MEAVDLVAARVREINGNVRVLVVLLVAWAAVYWWLNLSFLLSVSFAVAAMRDSGRSIAEGWVVPILMTLIGIVTAYVTATMLLAIERAIREMQALSKSLADRSSGLTAGTAERALFLRPVWPVSALMWSLGLHAVGSGLIAVVWLLLAAQEMR